MRLLYLLPIFLLLPLPGLAAEASPEAPDEQLLRAAGIAPEGPALLNYFRRRTLTDSLRERIHGLIRQTGDNDFEVRVAASAALIAEGRPALGQLRQAVQDRDYEVAQRAELCIEEIGRNPTTLVECAAARMVARLKPAGTAEVLLAFLPSADDEAVQEQVRAALSAVAVHERQPAPILVDALHDRLPLRRGAAAEALVRAGWIDASVRRLLADEDAVARLWVATALAERREREALPTLIELLTEAPLKLAWQIEEMLCRLAGEHAPSVALLPDDAARRKCREAWAAWWQNQGPRVDLARLHDAPRLLGRTLIVMMDSRVTNGRVQEIGPDGKLLWRIEGLSYPVDAQMLTGERVLIVEMLGRRVTEREVPSGKVVWEKELRTAMPVGCQRLPTGNTLIACRNLLVEVTRSGEEIFSYTRAAHDIMGAVKLRNGEYGFLTTGGLFVRIDATGKEVKSFPAGQGGGFAGLDALPNGRVLVPRYTEGKVAEFDLDGKLVWQAPAANPVSVQRLPNGNTLVGSMAHQQYVELDRDGKQVAETKVDGRLWRVRRR